MEACTRPVPRLRSPIRTFVLALVLILAMVAGLPADESFTTTGNVPLPDLGPGDYLGFQGGLYPGGTSIRPQEHLAAGLQAAGQIVPRNFQGQPSPTGRIALLSIGMSNTRGEFLGGYTSGIPIPADYPFLARAMGASYRNDQLVVVNGAQGGVPAAAWADRSSIAWQWADYALGDAGAHPNMVQAVWLKLADAQPSQYGPFPQCMQSLQGRLEEIVRILKERYPNLAIVYCSSRTRSWTTGADGDGTLPRMNPEPYAYQNGFAVRWMIERQLAGAEDLNFDAARGPVVAPWLTWGPYLWADGTNSRSDGLTWEFADVVPTDYTHPSPDGVFKVGSQLLSFFRTDPTAAWFRRQPSAPAAAVAADATMGRAPLTVSFSASDGPYTYAWNFDDGTTSAAQNPVKTFLHPGTYTVRASVADELGHHELHSLTITVGDAAAALPAMATGVGHSLALDDAGRVLSCGKNMYGQLGAPVPSRMAFEEVPGVAEARLVAAGAAHSLAVLQDGSLWAWGWNFQGQLGIGTNADAASPVAVSGLESVAGMSAGYGHSLAFREDGRLFAFGGNAYGQLGDGSNAQRPSPVEVTVDARVIQAAAGVRHSLVVCADGSVRAFGENASGQLGNGTNVASNLPVAVAGLTDVVKVAAGARHSLALRADGTVWAWGDNWAGQLGDGSNAPRPVPVQIPGLSGVVDIAAGNAFSVALLADGTVWTCGLNSNGQLGDGSLANRNVMAPASANGIAAIGAGAEQLFLMRDDGTVLAAGRNANAQLGLGRASTPILLPEANGVDLTR